MLMQFGILCRVLMCIIYCLCGDNVRYQQSASDNGLSFNQTKKSLLLDLQFQFTCSLYSAGSWNQEASIQQLPKASSASPPPPSTLQEYSHNASSLQPLPLSASPLPFPILHCSPSQLHKESCGEKIYQHRRASGTNTTVMV